MPFYLLVAEAGVPSIAEGFLWAILGIPLLAFLIIFGFRQRIPEQVSGYVSIGAISTTFILSIIVLFNVIGADGGIAIHTHNWFSIGELDFNLGIRIDGLTAIMLIVVTSVATLVQIYSQGYMHNDPGYRRYYAYMSLFATSMLGLILADNLLMLFVFWELVGLSSYLLIGFWFHKPSAAAAAKKAFIVTRIGDLGLLAALLLIGTRAATFQIDTIHDLVIAGAITGTTLTLFGLGIFAGAVGKSAQFPLHVWLPDAMEGPTPVSALIHAATMVVAGVYLVARFFPIFEASPDAREVVAWVGAITVAIGALIALVQTDLKRVLAYSTISQLGYMMLALGVFGYGAAVFHLFTHAFFKALLFLGSGSVNHATNTFDMRKMGGLRHTMPITFITFLIGSLSLAGIFPLAGFFSKDEILAEAWVENRTLYGIAAIAAFLTALYMFRAIFLTFFGKYKGGEIVQEEDENMQFAGMPSVPHESSRVMTIPLVILAIGAIGAGWLAFGRTFHEFVEAALPEPPHHVVPFSYGIAISSSVIALLGIATAWMIYQKKIIPSSEIYKTAFPFARLFEHKFGFDWLYEKVFVTRFFQNFWNRLIQQFDSRVVDAVVNASGAFVLAFAQGVRVVQNGQVQLYGVMMGVGLIAIVIIVFIANPL
jgi:NADH-quinone oxidoreductase subunit L